MPEAKPPHGIAHPLSHVQAATAACLLKATPKPILAGAGSTAADPADCFPVRIGHIPGRGRGFFAARNIARGETVFRAVPLAWAISEDWAKHTCWWCFAHDSRRPLPVKAAGSQGPSRGAQYKGVFCSDGCAQHAVHALGGQNNWDSYICLLNGIENQVVSLKANALRSPASRDRRAGGTSKRGAGSTAVHSRQQSSTDRTDFPDGCVSTFGVGAGSPASDVGTLAIVEFDPCEASDEQLAAWISTVWDAIAGNRIFSAEIPDSNQRELVRVIATELFLHDAAQNVSPAPVGNVAADSPDWMERVVSLDAAAGGVAPLSSLQHMRFSEIDVVRARLQQHTALPGGAEPLTPRTLVPLCVPKHPTAAQIEGSWWSGAFRVAAASYALLSRSWQDTTQTYSIGRLTHERFRAVYFREIANSFGIYDPPVSPSTLLSDLDSNGVYRELEQEYVGSSIYPTAVYFNHSCCPNIAKMRIGREMLFVSLADTKQGDELFISYGNISDPVAKRCSRLREHFFFDCICSRCVIESTAVASHATEAALTKV